MPDTGSPWNIPYVEAADLVRDWPADSLLVANAVAAGLSAAESAGIGSNVVQTVKLDEFTTTSGSMTDITGLTVTITPSSATAKVLVIADVSFSNTATDTTQSEIQLVRASTDIYTSTDGSATNQTSFHVANAASITSATKVFLDSPNTTSATTYKVQIRTGGGQTATVNRRGSNTQLGAVSSITVIEVAV